LAEFNNLACNIVTKRDVNDCNFAHLTLILLLHYFVKCRSILVIYNNEFILGSACCLRKSLWDHKIIENILLIKH